MNNRLLKNKKPRIRLKPAYSGHYYGDVFIPDIQIWEYKYFVSGLSFFQYNGSIIRPVSFIHLQKLL